MSGTIFPAALVSDTLAQTTGCTDKTQLDPEFSAIEQYLLKQEMARAGQMSTKNRCMVTLATLCTIQTPSRLGQATLEALNADLSVVEIKETLYQCAPYIGISKVEDALSAVNTALKASERDPKPAAQATVTPRNRFEKGLAVQKAIFGSAIDKMHANTPPEQAYISKQALTAYCFGDFYTRNGLDLKARELITFTAIMCLGGCEPQLRAHSVANITVGNTKQDLIDAIMCAMPFIGFPRTLNALRVINEILK